MGFPGGASGKAPASRCRRPKRLGFDPGGGEAPLEKGMATHSSILSWRIPQTEEPGMSVHGVAQSQTLLKQLSRQAHKISKWETAN